MIWWHPSVNISLILETLADVDMRWSQIFMFLMLGSKIRHYRDRDRKKTTNEFNVWKHVWFRRKEVATFNYQNDPFWTRNTQPFYLFNHVFHEMYFFPQHVGPCTIMSKGCLNTKSSYCSCCCVYCCWLLLLFMLLLV